MTEKQKIKILKIMKKKKQMTRSELQSRISKFNLDHYGDVIGYRSECLIHLTEYYIDELGELGEQFDSPNDIFALSDKGHDYLQLLKKDVSRMWVPVIISNIIAFTSLSLSIISIVMQL